MKIVLIGAVQFSFEMLSELILMNENIVGVVTTSTPSLYSNYFDLQPICERHNIPLIKLSEINSIESYNWLFEKAPDVIFCCGWARIIKPNILELPKKGVIGYHPSELPKNRGRHPLIWALALGLKKTGSTFFMMDSGADSGDIVSQELVNISKNELASTLYLKIVEIAKKQMREFVPKFKSDSLDVVKQCEAKANSWRKRGVMDGKIDFRMTAESICRLIRALDRPYPGAHFEYRGKEFKVWEAKPISFSGDNLECGKVLKINSGDILIKCEGGAVLFVNTEWSETLMEGVYLL
jgi:methionyl-tRNA formyltransferase